MSWSKEEHVVLEQLRELPEFRLEKERQFLIFEKVRNRVLPSQPRRKRQAMYAATACALVAVVLSVGVFGSDLLPPGNGSARSGAQSTASVTSVVLQLQVSDGESVTKEGLQATMRALERRMDVMGIEHTELEVIGTDQIRVHAGSTIDWDLLKKSLVQSAKLEFKAPDGAILLTGQDLNSNAMVLTNEPSGQKMVSLEFKDAVKLKEISETYLGKKLSIWLDDTLIEEPTISEVIIGGRVTINTDTPQQLADLMNAGALPYPLKEVAN